MKDWILDIVVSAKSKRILGAALGAGLVAWGEEMGMAQEQTLAISATRAIRFSFFAIARVALLSMRESL